MKKLAIITGASSGIGRATAEYFLARDYDVIATARDIKKPSFSHQNLVWKALNLSDTDSIHTFTEEILWEKIHIDALINNAGYGLMSSFEWATDEEIRAQFDVNYFGNIAIIRGLLPKFLKQKSGHIVTVTSIGGKIAFPFYGYYNWSKHALEATLESLWHEIKSTGIRIKIVEPGFVRTDFVSRNLRVGSINIPRLASAFAKLKKMTESSTGGSDPKVIAKTIFTAANSENQKLRYVTGYLGFQLIFLRRFLPEWIFRWLVGQGTL